MIIHRLRYGRRTFSQFGEDLIIEQILRQMQIRRPFYIDIGAFHPYKLSNTALLYRYGASGVNVEANPDLIGVFKKHRQRDITINKAVVPPGSSRCLPFYINSGCPEYYSSLIKNKNQDKVINVETIDVNALPIRNAHVLCIDTDGSDLNILRGMKVNPPIICVETEIDGVVNIGIKNHLIGRGYYEFAHTGVNSIFVKKRNPHP